MRKKAFLRGLLGFPLGISIGYSITIFSSLAFAQGYYAPCVPLLVETMGNEINAVILQAILSMEKQNQKNQRKIIIDIVPL